MITHFVLGAILKMKNIMENSINLKILLVKNPIT